MALRGTFGAPGGTGNVSVVIDPARLARFFRDENGPLLRRLSVDAEAVRSEAKRLVGYNDSPYRKASGPHLRDTIVKRFVESGRDGVAVQVGTEHPVALWHHEGTFAHVIRPRTKPFLVFYWAKVGRVVRMRSVNHPGTRPNRFLTDALRVLRGRY